MTLTLHERLNRSADLVRKTDEKLDGIELAPSDRVRIGAASFRVVLSHHRAINLLIRHEVYGSAFALVRSMYESYVRGIWLHRCATDHQIEAFEKKDCLDVSPRSIVENVEALEGYSAGVLGSFRQRNWSALCSYSHGGFRQIVRHMKSDSIDQNFDEQEIFEVIVLSDVFSLLAAFELANLSASDALANDFLNIMKEI